MVKENDEDCPQMLIKLAQTPFERQVAIEFVKWDDSLKKVKEECRWMKRICLGVLLAIAVNIVITVI